MEWIYLAHGREQGFHEHGNSHWNSDLILVLSNEPNWCLHKFLPEEGIKNSYANMVFFQILDNGQSPETARRIISVNSAIFREAAVRILVGVIRAVLNTTFSGHSFHI
jgi:hypothetical protein